MRVIVIFLLTSILAFSQTKSTNPTNNNSTNNIAPVIDLSEDKDDSEDQEDLFDLLFSDAKSFYVEALISGFYHDTTEVKYCFDRTFEIVAEISELDTLTAPENDELTRFCEKLTFDYQSQFSYLNGDTGTTGVAFIRNYISEKVIDTVKVGEDELVVLDDRPGHLPLVTSKKIDRIINFLSSSIIIKLNILKKSFSTILAITKNNEIILKKSIPESALWSEKSLSKTWLNKEEDEIWKDL